MRAMREALELFFLIAVLMAPGCATLQQGMADVFDADSKDQRQSDDENVSP